MPKASKQVMADARSIVRTRDGHRCQMCGKSIVDRPSAIHHRRRKGMGGSAVLERPSNLLRVCGHGNKDLCHGLVHGFPAQSNEEGWVLWQPQDPAATPILLFDGWFLLDDFGGRLPYVGEVPA